MLRQKQSPFPGMNPYFEAPEHWRGFHNHLASEIIAQLEPQLGLAYAIEAEITTVMETINLSEVKRPRPDVSIHHASGSSAQTTSTLTATLSPPTTQRLALAQERVKLRRVVIRLTTTGELVTAIEILSPTNKRGEGLHEYRAKRERILRSDVHLIELDLLRAGKRPGLEVDRDAVGDNDYVVVVNRSGEMRFSDIWASSISEPLPTIPVPLLYPDEDLALNLTAAVHALYQRYGYWRIIDYSQPIPTLNLRPDMLTWWNEQLIAIQELET